MRKEPHGKRLGKATACYRTKPHRAIRPVLLPCGLVRPGPKNNSTRTKMLQALRTFRASESSPASIPRAIVASAGSTVLPKNPATRYFRLAKVLDSSIMVFRIQIAVRVSNKSPKSYPKKCHDGLHKCVRVCCSSSSLLYLRTPFDFIMPRSLLV